MTLNNLRRVCLETSLEKEEVILLVCKTIKGVKLPQEILKEFPETIGVNLGLNLPNPIQDLVINDTGISATLSFRGVFSSCFFTWDSVVSIQLLDNSLIPYEACMFVSASNAVPDDNGTTNTERKLKLVN